MTVFFNLLQRNVHKMGTFLSLNCLPFPNLAHFELLYKFELKLWLGTAKAPPPLHLTNEKPDKALCFARIESFPAKRGKRMI